MFDLSLSELLVLAVQVPELTGGASGLGHGCRNHAVAGTRWLATGR